MFNKNRSTINLNIFQGLFQKAIIMSGSAIAPYNEPTKNPYIQATKQASVVEIPGIQGMNTKKLVEKLREVDAVKLVDSIDQLKVMKKLFFSLF